MDLIPQCFISSFFDISPLAPGKEDFQDVLPYAHDDNLCHVTSLMLINFHYLLPQCTHTIQFGLDASVVSQKSFPFNMLRYWSKVRKCP